MKQDKILEDLAKELMSERHLTRNCPAQKEGKEVDQETTNYCSLPEIHCLHRGIPRIFETTQHQIQTHYECKYEGR